MSKEDSIDLILFAGLVGSIVENKSMDESLKEVGLSEDYLLKFCVAPQSSDVVIDYVKERMFKQCEMASRDEAQDLYLVKKVFCDSSDYDVMAEAISGKDTDKFQVLRLIGSHPLVSEYKQKEHGLEAYLVSGKNPLDAMRKTTTNNPIIHYSADHFDGNYAKKFDELITNALYNHTPEDIKKLFDAI